MFKLRFYLPSTALLAAFLLPVPAQSLDKSRIKLVQGRKKVPVTDGSVIEIKRKKFAFLFPLKTNQLEGNLRHNYKFHVSAKEMSAGLKTGMKIDATPWLADKAALKPGRGNRYHHLTLSETGHHYLYYSRSLIPRNRVQNHRKLNRSTIRAKFTVLKLKEDKTRRVRKSKTPELFLTILNDDNLNGIIDAGELFRAKIVFK